MHEMLLCFAGQNVSPMMCGEACPADGCGTRSVLPGSFSNPPRSGTASQFRHLCHNFNLQELKQVSHKSVVFTSSPVGN